MVSVRLDPVRLWPPNHRMVDVHATVAGGSGCAGTCPAPVVVLSSITSSEPDDADIQDADVGSADFDFKLRAERDSSGHARLYEVTYTVTDCSGGVSVGHAGVLVARD